MSVNISKIRREQLLQKIEEIRLHLLKNAPNPQLEDYLLELASEIKNRKFGLVFEKHREKIDDLMLTHLPVLTEDKELTIDNGGQWNFLIEGDNLPALELLLKTHKGKIDACYIDPPYNRGDKDFIYDDDYVDKEDSFKHSKWLSFMEKRLNLAKLLLSDDGVIFISIDDNEYTQLKMICDEIFGDKNFIANIPRRTKSSGKSTNKIAQNHDYVLVYSKRNDIVALSGLSHVDKEFKYKDEFYEERGPYKLNQPLDYDSLQYSKSLDYPIELEGRIFYPGGSKEAYENRQKGNFSRADWAWRWSKDKFEFGLKNGFIVLKENKNGSCRIYTKTYLNATIEKDSKKGYKIKIIDRTKPLTTLEFMESKYSNDNGSKNLNEILPNCNFDYPKPVQLIKTLLEIVNKENITVLDFFAGSGTTAQAVLELNEDGQQRKFILITNNQNNICKEITYQRIKNVIEKKNYQASLKYYRVDLINTEGKVYYEYANELLKHIRELVQLENGVDLNSSEEFAIVLTDEEMDEFVVNLSKRSRPCRKLYIGYDVLPDPQREQELVRNRIDILRIPDYYYSERRG
jgi:adenine-specific DNA-methyltransferase